MCADPHPFLFAHVGPAVAFFDSLAAANTTRALPRALQGKLARGGPGGSACVDADAGMDADTATEADARNRWWIGLVCGM